MTYRLRNIVLAVVLGIAAVALVSVYVANYKRTVRQGEETVTVFVAAKEIPEGTTGAQAFERGMIRSDDVARRVVVPGAISQPNQVHELIATETIYPGEQVSVQRFRPVEAAGVLADLTGNMRVIQVPGDGDQLLAGTLKDGDRVDVVAVFPIRREQVEINVTRIVLRDILVLKAAEAGVSGPALSASQGGFSVQLAVTDTQSRKLFLTTKAAQWSLQLRPVVGPEDSPEGFETPGTLLRDGLPPSQLQKLFQEGG
jgi:Flp pilus assembly protein CpaB